MKYMDKVKITGGFYEGQKGWIVKKFHRTVPTTREVCDSIDSLCVVKLKDGREVEIKIEHVVKKNWENNEDIIRHNGMSGKQSPVAFTK